MRWHFDCPGGSTYPLPERIIMPYKLTNEKLSFICILHLLDLLE
jgi:hypothetical protein